MATRQVERAASFHPRGTLIATALRHAMRRASWAGSIVAGIVAAALATGLRDRGFGGVVTAAGVATVTGLLVAYLAMPWRTRRALETLTWLGRRELDRIREQTGARYTGTTPDGAARWLTDNPRSSVTAVARIDVLTILGRIDEADAEATRLPPPRDDIEAVAHVLNRVNVRFVADEPIDERLRAEVVELQQRLDPASEAAAEMRVGLAVTTARERLAAGRGDWDEELLAVRPTLGSAPTRTLLRDVWSRLALSLLCVALAVGLIVGLLPGVAGV